MYVNELAHSSIRGTLGTFFQVQITVGALVEYLLGKKLRQRWRLELFWRVINLRLILVINSHKFSAFTRSLFVNTFLIYE